MFYNLFFTIQISCIFEEDVLKRSREFVNESDEYMHISFLINSFCAKMASVVLLNLSKCKISSHCITREYVYNAGGSNFVWLYNVTYN